MPNERTMIETARQIVERGLSVRDVERIAQDARTPSNDNSGATTSRQPAAAPRASGRDAELRRLTEALRRHLQTDVRITADGEAKGEIAVRFYSSDDLHRLIELLLGRSLDEA